MLRLLDALYRFDFDGDLTGYLFPEEREDYQLALRNQEEAREEEDRLSFRRRLALGLKLGALGGR